MAKVSAATEKIGGQVLGITKIVEEAFAAQKDLIIKVKQHKVSDGSNCCDFVLSIFGLSLHFCVVFNCSGCSQDKRWYCFGDLPLRGCIAF